LLFSSHHAHVRSGEAITKVLFGVSKRNMT